MPTAEIFLYSGLVLLLTALPLWLLYRRQAGRKTPLRPMLTPWGEELDRDHPLPEYPRPQFKRDSYINLNGVWWYAFTETPDIPDEDPKWDNDNWLAKKQPTQKRLDI